MFDAIFATGSQSITHLGQHSTAMDLIVQRPFRSPNRLLWTSEMDKVFHRMRTESEVCATDLQLLEWAGREVFGESRFWPHQEEARRAFGFQKAGSSGSKPSPSSPMSISFQFQSTYYPHLLATLMRAFRDKYKDPHLAMCIFEHARCLSIASFVYGCTTPSYNELIETRWQCFRDLRGVCDTLEDMWVNSVPMDRRTRLLAEAIRREVSERTFWQEESSVGSEEVREMLARLDRVSSYTRTRQANEGTPGRRKRERVGKRKHKESVESNNRSNWDSIEPTSLLAGRMRTRRMRTYG